ncbi:hypothetical protein [Alcanivorax sp.]|uniref:hypothetical protein n=1 Tax=Alcanivorax TaxID=59753 RepID=UPI0025C281C1|nr:hypothetical protein [Alcanivorax sp.]
MNRKISVSGLSHDSASAFVSMMGIINGRCSVIWENADSGQADVLLVAAQDAKRAANSKSGKPCIVVYPSSQDRPDAPFTLSHPFRAMHMIRVLEDVARALPG